MRKYLPFVAVALLAFVMGAFTGGYFIYTETQKWVWLDEMTDNLGKSTLETANSFEKLFELQDSILENDKATAEIREMNKDVLNVSDQLDKSLNESKFIQLLKSMN